MVDLRTCKAGDRLLSKHGWVLTYVYRKNRLPEDHDIVAILPKGA